MGDGVTTRRRCLLIHGWRVKDPAISIGLLARPLWELGYEPILLNYGFTLTPMRTIFRTRKSAKCWSARTLPSDIVIGHSQGCNVAFEMSHLTQNQARTMVWINPALDADCIPGRSVHNLLVVYNHGDLAVRAGSLLPNSIWGDMGCLGYQPSRDPFGPDPRIQCSVYGRGHSPWRDPSKLTLTIHRWVLTNPVLMEG